MRAAGALHVDLDKSAISASARQPLDAWVQRSAAIVGAYYGRFPIYTVTLRIVAVPGEGGVRRQDLRQPRRLHPRQAGSAVTRLRNSSADWVLVHEMTHLALPDTGEEHAWLSEGMAVYVEGMARVQAGNRSETDMWAEELRPCRAACRRRVTRVMDHTHTWGRTYWGGAMFCLLADVQIREKTANRFGLQDALRAVLAQSGGLGEDWPIEKVMRTGDAATGTHVLEELYATYKDKPVTPDLAGLWHRLGVAPSGDSVTLTDDAPLAQVRHAIMRAPGK